MNIEQQRAAFEAWHCKTFATKHSTGQPTRDMHNGIYDENYGPAHQQHMWEAFQAAIEQDRQSRGEPVGRTFAVACFLSRSESGKYITSGTLSIRKAETPEEAKGLAVQFALEVKPGFSLDEILCSEVSSPQPAEPVKAESTYSDNMRTIAARNLRSFLNNSSFKLDTDRQAAFTCVDVLEAKAEPVKEPSDEDLFTIHDEFFPTIIIGHDNYLRFARALLARHGKFALAVKSRRDTLLSVLGKLNSNPYSLTKSECIDVVREMLEEADAAMQQGKL